MNRTLCRLLATLLCCNLNVALGQNSADSVPSFKSQSELVVLTAVVTQHGEAMRGLSKPDFVLLHEGVAEKIAFVEEIDAAPAKIDRGALPPNSVQNYAIADNHQDVVILLLDYLNGNWSTSARINSYLSDLARQLGETHTPASVLLLSTKGLVEAHSFTTDMQSFTKAVQRLGSEEGRKSAPASGISLGWASAIAETTDVGTNSIFREFALPASFTDRIKLDRALMTQQALEQLAESYRGIPGRKKLIWVSTGFPIGLDPGAGIGNGGDASAEFRIQDKAIRAWKALSNANIAVYPVGTSDYNSDWDTKFSPAHRGSMTAPISGGELTNEASLMEMAHRTGGQFCTDLPTGCLKKALADGPHYYILGFYLAKDAKPGWHKLRLKVNRPDTSVRAREGFFVGNALKDSLPSDKDQVLTALASPLDYTSVPLRLRWNAGTMKGERAIEFILNSPPGGIAVEPEDSSLKIDILAYVRPVGASEGMSFPASFNSKMTPALQASLRSSGFQFRKQIPLAPGRYELRLFLRDNVAKKVGTVSTIVDLTKQ